MRPNKLTLAVAATETAWFKLDWEQVHFEVGLFVEEPAGATLTAGIVQYTIVDPELSVPTAEQIFDDTTLTGLSASAYGTTPGPVYAVRLIATTVAGADVFLHILQGDRY